MGVKYIFKNAAFVLKRNTEYQRIQNNNRSNRGLFKNTLNWKGHKG